MEFGSILAFNKIVNPLPSIAEAPCQQIRQRQVVTVVVGGRIEVLGLLQIGNGLGHFIHPRKKLAEIVIGFVVLRSESHCFLELLLGQVRLA